MESVIAKLCIIALALMWVYLFFVKLLDMNKMRMRPNRKIRIYISGSITNYGYDKAKELFSFTEHCINDMVGSDYVAINPMRIADEVGKPWIWYIIKDLKILSKCEVIFMLPTWEDSRGAKIERLFAKLTFKKIIYS